MAIPERMSPHQLLDIFIGGIVIFFDVSRVDFPHTSLPAQFEGAERILAAAANDCEVIDAAPAADLVQGATDQIVPTGELQSAGPNCRKLVDLPTLDYVKFFARHSILRTA